MPKFSISYVLTRYERINMEIIKGNYSSAKIFTTNNAETAIDHYARCQLQALCDNEVSANTIIRVMPDVHPGVVGTIGLTMTVGQKLMPNLTGIDIGCGMLLGQIKSKKIEFQKLDTVIRENIPSGFTVRNKVHRLADEFDFTGLHCYKHIQLNKALLSLGTLGGGNHFIEIDKDEDNNLYVIIHSGSRHLGKEITEYYLSAGKKHLEEKGVNIPYELTYLEDELLNSYLHDIKIIQDFASLNREIILDELVKGMKLKLTDSYECIHNYIDASDETLKIYNAPMLRKGAISAKLNEKVIIPVNMRDGVILGEGLGNAEWNHSAPHGAGRIMKRNEVKSHYTVSSYKSAMKGIYSSCINADTLDESPFAYRTLEDIRDIIKDTVQITNILTPIYNFKAGDKKC